MDRNHADPRFRDPDLAAHLLDNLGPTHPPKTKSRTLQDFPHAFYPMAIVTGDKREDSESRITVGDFGAVSASPAESRWLLRLGLRSDVEIYSDKVFLLQKPEELRERFGEKHLLVIGSPGSNHFARLCPLSPPLRGF